MANVDDSSTCTYASVCHQRNLSVYDDCTEDQSYLGWRVLGTICAWFVLGKAVSESTFFVACALFVYPILLDCIKMRPVNRLRKQIRCIEVGVSMTWLLFSFLGMAGIITFAENSTSIIQTADDYIGFSFHGVPVQYVLRGLLSMVVVTVLDYICKVTAVDTKYDNVKTQTQGAK